RYLDTDAGRWMSADPAFTVLSPERLQEQLTDATSLYAYVGNQLMNAVDPDGLTGRRASRSRLGKMAHLLNVRARLAVARVRNTVRKHGSRALAVASIVGTAVINPLGAAINAVGMTVGMAAGYGVREILRRNHITLPKKVRKALRCTGHALAVAGGVAIVASALAGIGIVTGGAGFVAGVGVIATHLAAKGLGNASIISHANSG